MLSKEETKPTRTELIRIQKKISLYDRGYKLLKMKRDGLVIEFFGVLSKARDIRSRIREDYKKAEEKLIIATSVDGETTVISTSFAIREDPEIEWKLKM
jgi:V/A-type H+-transporting ATPase subunit D